MTSGTGALDAVSTSQKWNGTIAALMRKPTTTHVVAMITSRSARPSAVSWRPIWARFSAPVRA